MNKMKPIKQFELLSDLVRDDSFLGWGFKPEFDGKVFIGVNWFNEEYWKNIQIDIALSEFRHKNTARFCIWYDSIYYTYEMQKQIEEDIERICKYLWAPRVKQMLREHDLDIRVEFYNTKTRRKTIKGFITKE